MSYLFCIVTNLCNAITIGWLGYLVFRGATTWIILVMVGMASCYIIPANDIFTCPKCGHTETVKTFRAHNIVEMKVVPQNKKEQ